MNRALGAARLRDVLALAVALLTCLAICTYTLALDREALDIPLHYSGDSLQYGYLIRHFSLAGGVGAIDAAGTPFGTQHYDFPNADFTHLALASTFSVGDSFGLGFNLFYLFGVLATCLAGYALARRVGLQPAWAVLAAVAFTLLPFHFLRQPHLFYTNYSSLAVALWLALEASGSTGSLASRPWLRRGLLVLAALWCASTGVYYAFFGCLLIGFAGLCAAVEQQRVQPLLRSLLVCALISAGVLAQLLPSVQFKAEAGANPSVAQRHFSESEIYGLRLTQLVLPNASHPIEVLGRVRRAYDAGAPNVNENATAGVGLLGTTGLALAALMLAVPRLAAALSPLAHPLARLLAFLFVFATTGGLASLFAIAVTPQIRAVNRISPLLALLAILLACLVLQHLVRGRRGGIQVVLAMILVALVALDQVPRTRAESIRERAAIAANYRADAQFGASLEQALPPAARVFQLPVIAYPEAGSALGDYRQFRNPLHAPRLHFTHGAMRGRPEAEWLQQTAALAPDAFADSLERLGFAAVVVDTAGQSREIQAQVALLQQRGWQRLEASDGSQFALLATRGAPAAARAVAVEHGWYPLEQSPDGRRWRWSQGVARLRIAPGDTDCELSLRLSALQAGEARWRVEGRASSHTFALQTDLASEVLLRVPAGATRVELHPPAVTRAPGADPRMLGLMLHLSSALECRNLEATVASR